MVLNSHFRIHTRSRFVSKEEATNLCSKPNHGFVRAEPKDGGYLFVTEYAECPYCGAHITAQECESRGLGNASLRRSEAQKKWPGAVQFTNLDFGALKELCCPGCGTVSYRADVQREMLTESDGATAVVKIRLLSIREMLSTLMLLSDEESIDFTGDCRGEYYEVLRMHTDTGKTEVSLENSLLGTLCTQDITDGCRKVQSACFSLFSHPEVLGFLMAQLWPHWQIPFPFNRDTARLEELVLANRFQGFSGDFYNAFPYYRGTSEPAGSFTERLEHLKNAEAALQYFEECRLPHTKTVRTAVFKNQWLFFYLPELELLYADTKYNTDNLVTLMKSKRRNLMTLLMTLHCYPESNIFFNDFLRDGRRAKNLASLLGESLFDLMEYAKRYAMLAPPLREHTNKNGALNTAELRRTFEQMPVLPVPYRLIPYSVPFFVDDTSAEGRFGGYCFRYLRNNDEAFAAGTELNNCLKTWSSLETPVIVVYRGNRAAAAIEIDPYYGMIEQARIKDNHPIEEDSELLAVFDEWLETTEFLYTEPVYGIDDGEDLPF